MDIKKYTVHIWENIPTYERRPTTPDDIERNYYKEVIEATDDTVYSEAIKVLDEDLFNKINDNTPEEDIEMTCREEIEDADWGFGDPFIMAIHNDTDNSWVYGNQETIDAVTRADDDWDDTDESLNEKLEITKNVDKKGPEAVTSTPLTMANAQAESEIVEDRINDEFAEQDKIAKEFVEINHKRDYKNEKSELKKMHLSESLFEDYYSDKEVVDNFLDTIDGLGISDLKDIVTMCAKWMKTADFAEMLRAYEYDEEQYRRPLLHKEKDIETLDEKKNDDADLFTVVSICLSPVLDATERRYVPKDLGYRSALAYDHVYPTAMGLVVYGKDEKHLEYAKRVADYFGLEYRIKPDNNKRTNDEYKLKMYINIPVNESLNESKNNHPGMLGYALQQHKDELALVDSAAKGIALLDKIADEVDDKKYLNKVKTNISRKPGYRAAEYLYDIILKGEDKGRDKEQ